MEIENTRDIHIKLPNDQAVPRITGCTFMADGQLLVCDSENNNIKLLNSKFDIIDSLRLYTLPFGISAVDSVTAVITSPGSHSHLQFIDIVPSLKAGKQIQLDKSCYGVDVVRDGIYVTCRDNPGNAEIRVFDKNGTFIRKIPDVNNNLSSLRHPHFIAVNITSSKIYVSDLTTHTVRCISVDGSLVFNYKHDDLRWPRTVIADEEGNILVCGQDSHNIHVVTSTGQHHSVLYTVRGRRYNGCMSLAYRPADRTLVIGLWDDSMLVLKLSRNKTTNFQQMKVQNSRNVTIKLPNDERTPIMTGCTFMAHGQLLVCDNYNHNIILLNSKLDITDSLGFVSGPWDTSVIDNVTAVVTLPYRKQLQFIDIVPSLKAGKQLQLDKRCWGVDVVRDGIYVTCHDNPGNAEIRVFDKNGTFIRKIPDVNNNLPSLRYPHYIAVNTTSSKIYVSDLYTDTVRCISVDGSLVFNYKHADLRYPRTVIADEEGNILVCGWDSDNIHVVTSTGQHHSVLYTVQGRRYNECQSMAYRPDDHTLVIGLFNDNNLLVLECAKSN